MAIRCWVTGWLHGLIITYSQISCCRSTHSLSTTTSLAIDMSFFSIVSLLTSNKIGSRGRARTFNISVNSRTLYHWATLELKNVYWISQLFHLLIIVSSDYNFQCLSVSIHYLLLQLLIQIRTELLPRIRAVVLPIKLRSLPSPNVFGNWHGRWVTLPHWAVLETAAFLVCHVHIVRVWWIASTSVIYRYSRKLEPTAGIEPATGSLQNYCSTAELSWRLKNFSLTSNGFFTYRW